MNSIKSKIKSFQKLLYLIDNIREECPWDREQTFDSLSHLTIEETFELVEEYPVLLTYNGDGFDLP